MNPHGRGMTVPASGSGFIIDRQGHILTNNHVVRDASEITVTLNDKRTFKAKVVGRGSRDRRRGDPDRRPEATCRRCRSATRTSCGSATG